MPVRSWSGSTARAAPSVASSLLFVVSLAACGPSDASSGSDGTDGESLGGDETGSSMPVMDVGDDMTDPTICPTPFDSGGDPSSMLPPAYVDCALPSPCDEVRFVEGQDFDLVLENPAALTCVLDALADGAPAEVVLKTETYISGETTIVRAYDMGRAEISYSSWFDSAYDASRTPYEGVAGYDFSACDGQQAWSDVWPCIQAGFSTCGTWAADEDLCPAGP